MPLRRRLFPVILLTALLPALAPAQGWGLADEWQWSVSLAPELSGRVGLSNYLREELAPESIPADQQRFLRTITVGGRERDFFPDYAGRRVERREARPSFAGALGLHRHFPSGLNVGLGAYYARQGYRNVPTDVGGAPANTLYTGGTVRRATAGLILRAEAYALRRHRWSPYAGFTTGAVYERRRLTDARRVYSDGGTLVLDPAAGFAADGVELISSVVAGFVYRLGERWRLGAEYSPYRPAGQGPVSLQLRRRL